MLLQGNVGLQSQSASAQAVVAAMGRQGEQMVSLVHGKYYNLAAAGRLFMATTVIAGVALPVAAATLNSKFTLHNPMGSGVNVVPVYFAMGIDSATTVVNGIGMAIQRNLTTTAGIPTTLSLAAALPLGVSGTPGAAVYTQATLTNVAIPGVSAATAVPIPLYPLFSFGAVTAPTIDPCGHDFDGRVILGPDSLGAFCTTVAAATAAFCSVIWAEIPA